MTNITIGGSDVSIPLGTSVTSPRNVYTTLPEVRTYLSFASQNTADDNQLKDFIRRASRAIDNRTKRHFYPNRKTLYYDDPVDSQKLKMEHEVLEVHGLSHLNGASAIPNSIFWLKNGDDWNLTPYDQLIIDDSSGSTFSYSGTPTRSVHLDATTGFHQDYNNAWVYTGTCISNQFSSAASVIYANGTSNSYDSMGNYPRFSSERLLKVDDEYIHLVSVDGNALQVQRGTNGTTASEHASGLPIYVFYPEEEIRFATLRLVAWTFEQTKSPFTQRIAFPQLGGAIEMPDAWPQDVKERIEKYRRKNLYRGF